MTSALVRSATLRAAAPPYDPKLPATGTPLAAGRFITSQSSTMSSALARSARLRAAAPRPLPAMSDLSRLTLPCCFSSASHTCRA